MAAEKNATRDIPLWIVAVLILAGGIYGFAYLEGQVMDLVRIVGLLAVIAIAVVVASRTRKGGEFFSYVREVDVERRKVVWPTRQETLQTTLIVLVITVIVGLILFLMDTLFGFAVRRLIGLGGEL
ncbi:preprotein translocase subunit SecE [Halomonas denitrificans]|nr:preprotein translocase subunit SecE [Halomonas denitrificans]